MKNHVVLEPGGIADLSAIMPVMAAAFDNCFGEAWSEAQCAGILALPRSALIIARVDGNVAGFGLLRWVLDEAELLLLAVAPAHQRHAIGTVLLRSVLQSARGDKAKRIFLEVRDSNPARLFYEQSGFVRVGTRPHYYSGQDGSRHDALTYALQLVPA